MFQSYFGAQSRSYLYTLGPKVGILYVLGALDGAKRLVISTEGLYFSQRGGLLEMEAAKPSMNKLIQALQRVGQGIERALKWPEMPSS